LRQTLTTPTISRRGAELESIGEDSETELLARIGAAFLKPPTVSERDTSLANRLCEVSLVEPRDDGTVHNARLPSGVR
jgi:hypothetical protein